MPLAIDADRDAAEERQQEHPEHHRAVETAPVGGDAVEERLDAVGVVLDVADRVVAGDERVDDHTRGDREQRRDGVKGADAALDEPVVSPPGAGDRSSRRIRRDNECDDEDERTE